ncbi:MAG: apolipoprotein A1/A4/E family protein [Actinomycetota bacterium]|nr:apolipoprotein A1/A4/E family protein [Actinomycetota bacterium]
MTPLTMPKPVDLQGRTLFDATGQGIGTIEGVYLDNVTRTPEWAAVRLGPQSLALVPLSEASMTPDGAQVDFDRAMVLAAPHRLTGLDSEVTEETEGALYRYYGADDDPAHGEGNSDSDGTGTMGEALDVAKDVAVDVKEQAADVAGTAKEDATQVAGEVRDQAVAVVASAKDQATSVAETAKEETAEVVHQASTEARELFDVTRTELQSQAETQLEQFADTLHRLAGQALALARGNADQSGQVGDLVGRAGRELRSVALDIRANGSAGLLEGAQRTVKRRPRAAIIGTAAAVVAGAKPMGTPAGERLKERLAPLTEQAIEAGRSVAEELEPVAQQGVENVKAVAARAADEVRQEAQGTAEDVRQTAAQAGKTVKGTARRSAADVKGTARRSAADVKGTARRSAATTKRTTRAVPAV